MRKATIIAWLRPNISWPPSHFGTVLKATTSLHVSIFSDGREKENYPQDKTQFPGPPLGKDELLETDATVIPAIAGMIHK